MITSDTNFRGNYDSIEAVWEAIPYGGVEGDYLNIQGVKYRWNKYLAMWENAEVVTETPARETVTFDEDVNMQNNLTVAGVLRAKELVAERFRAWNPKGNYDATKVYSINDLVYDSNTKAAYLSMRSNNIGHPVDENDESYEEGWWMEVQTIGVPQGDYSSSSIYNVGDVVYDSDTNTTYMSLRADNIGHPVTDEMWWMKIVDGSYEKEAAEIIEAAVAEVQELTEESVETIQSLVDNLPVTQVTGDSTTSVMSQKVVTDALTNINAKDDLYEERILNESYSSDLYGYACIHTHFYDGHIWMACCTNNVFRLFRDGTQVKSISSRWLAGVYVTDGIVYYVNYGGTLYSMTMDTYTESTLATFSVPAAPAGTRLYVSFCTFNGDIHFVLSFRYNATADTPIKLYKYDAEDGVVFIKDVIGSATNLPADVMADGENMYVIYNYNRGDNRIYKLDAEYNVSFYEYAFFLKNSGANNTSCIIKGNKYPLAMKGYIISLWNASMPVNISLTHFSGYECAAVSAEINGDYLYLATFGRNGSNGVLRVHKLNKDYFDNFFDCKANNEMYIKNVSELKYGQTGIMSYQGRVLEYSFGVGTALRKRYAPFGIKDTYKVKATGTSYRKYALISQGQCQHIARVFTAQANENIYHSAAFRIPTICTYNGVLYAACSARLSGPADSSPANTVVARSYDSGVTWQDYGTATTRLAGGTDVDGNIYVCQGGSHAGRLWVFADRYDNTSLTKNENYQFIGCYSDDGGLTWSEPVNYLPAVIAAAAEAGYTISYCRTGNGSGVTLANGTLAISIGLFVSGRQAAALWYTTDGVTWQLGDILPNDESNESALALVGNEIYITYRMNSNRGFAKLSSIGGGWTKITTATNPNGNSSNLTVGWGYCNGVFLLSCPYSANRNNLSLYKSRDLVTWTRVIQFTSSSSSAANLQGYTCMVFTQSMLKVFAEMKENDQNVFDFDYLLPSIFS